MDKRLDFVLVEKKLAKSRERAKEMIKNEYVKVNGFTAAKPSQFISDESQITICGESLRYVGRGGLKLEKALDVFNIDLREKICADIGASTGGFTDCMLQNGAKMVYAVDVGHDQLDEKLINDNRVVNIEKTNIRDVNNDLFSEEIKFISIDVSFISLKLVLPKVKEILSESGEFVALIKPQFEAGKKDVGKNGIVKSNKIHIGVLAEICSFTNSFFAVKAVDFSPISGGDGNVEYLLYATAKGISKEIDIKAIVKNAFDSLKGGN